MPWGLKRYYGTGSLHFITWSCYRRKPLLGNPARRDLLLTVLDRMRVRYRFAVIGYVVMPEHVHLLISEPLIGDSLEDSSSREAERLPAASHCGRILR
jgi:putative transposase